MAEKIQVWSAGLEEWEDAVLSKKERSALVHVHDKTAGYEIHGVYKDALGRWVRILNASPVTVKEDNDDEPG